MVGQENRCGFGVETVYLTAVVIGFGYINIDDFVTGIDRIADVNYAFVSAEFDSLTVYFDALFGVFLFGEV